MGYPIQTYKQRNPKNNYEKYKQKAVFLLSIFCCFYIWIWLINCFLFGFRRILLGFPELVTNNDFYFLFGFPGFFIEFLFGFPISLFRELKIK
jgi:hypothetical protein